jgi:hypothetical protein
LGKPNFASISRLAARPPPSWTLRRNPVGFYNLIKTTGGVILSGIKMLYLMHT